VVNYLRVFHHVGFFLVLSVGKRLKVLTMSAFLMKDRLPSEVLDSDTHNRLQMRRAIQTRGDPTAKAPIGTVEELLRVLVVDDYPASADTMAMLVDAWGHDVRRAYNGTTGVALAAAYQPDVLLLDLLMPGMSGLDVARQVRQRIRLNRCFMIAVTGHTNAGHRLQCEEAGIDLFLIKPVTPSILQALLIWESEYILRSRQHKAADEVLTATLNPLTDPISQRSTQLACHVLQGAVA
jgi:CheY-like chemotaxis protein